MKKILILLTAIIIFSAQLTGFAQSQNTTQNDGVAFVIPIHDMIERALVYFIRRSVKQAEQNNADVIIIDMNTPGGRLDATADIIKILTSTKIPTYTFVNPDAISAGAIIAMATDHIYMAPGSRIGDAMPIMISPLPMGGPKAIPDDLKEKAVSPTVAMIRGAAQRKGHDPLLAEAMVRAEIEYKIGDKVICPKGQLLTLTNIDAQQMVGAGTNSHPLLSSGTVNNIQELLTAIGHKNDKIITIKETLTEKIARIIDGFPMSGILLALGLIGLYIEYKTPGFGIPGISGLLLLALWFWGHNIAGVSNIMEITIFLIGVILLMAELFIIPGFGFVGITGAIMIMAGIFMSMIGTPHFSTPDFSLPAMEDITRAIMNLSIAMILLVITGAILSKVLPESPVLSRLYLNTAQHRKDGYVAAEAPPDIHGQQGITVTQLRPSGVIKLGDRRIDVVTRGEFIDKGEAVIVAETKGRRIIVEKCDELT